EREVTKRLMRQGLDVETFCELRHERWHVHKPLTVRGAFAERQHDVNLLIADLRDRDCSSACALLPRAAMLELVQHASLVKHSEHKQRVRRGCVPALRLEVCDRLVSL